MLVAIVAVFFLCWTPFHAQRLLFMWITLYGAWSDQLMNVHYVLFIISGILYYFNSAINPVLYCIMSKR